MHAELNFEGLEIQKMKYANWHNSKIRWKKLCHLSSYHVYSQSYGH